MPVLSYIHHLFDIAQCHAYIHTLHWKDQIPSDFVVKGQPIDIVSVILRLV